jgi:hypothetical protein
MEDKFYLCNCERPDYEELRTAEGKFCEWLETAESVEVEEFVNYCDLSKDILKNIIMYPSDFDFKTV